MFYANSHYQIGNSHKFCEDFAIHSFNEKQTFSIICDGCSSSGIVNGIRQPLNVDFGARILAVLLGQCIREVGVDFLFKESESGYITPYMVRERVLHLTCNKVKKILNELNVPINVLNSTLLFAGMSNEYSGTLCIGDGVIVIQTEDNAWHIKIINYTENAPFYISYFLEEKSYENYLKSFKNQKINIFSFDTVDFKEIYNENFLEVGSINPLFFSIPNTKKIALFSDGIQTFGTEEESKIGNYKNILEILPSLLEFSNLKGEFVTKRFNVLNRWMKKNNVYHSDDLSMTVIGKLSTDTNDV